MTSLKFLVSSPRGIYLVNDNKVKLIIANHHIYGLTWSDKHIYGCARIKNGTNILIMNNKCDIEAIHKLQCVKDVHQAHYMSHTDEIAMANTRFDRIEFYNPNNGKHRYINWTKKGTDTNHINSIWYDGEYYWSCEHRKGKHPSNVVQFNEDLSIVNKFVVAKNIHNVYVANNCIYTTVSIESKVIKFNIQKNRVIKYGQYDKIVNKNHTRGIAYNGKIFIIGASQFLKRSERTKSLSGWVFIVDNNFNLLECIELPNANQVYDVRILNDCDYAHNGIVKQWE